MKPTRWIFTIIISAFVLNACSGNFGTPAAIPTVSLSPSKPNTSSANEIVASAEIAPAQKVQMSFPGIGIVKTVEVNEGDVVTAGQTLITLDTALLEARVIQAEADVVAAESQVRYLKRVGSGQEQIDAAIADTDRARASVDSVKAQLAQAALVTPIGGTVAQVNIAPGESVVPGQVVILIGDLAHMRIETTDLSEKDVPNVKVGMQAKVQIDALDKEFTGKVIDIARVSSTVGGDVVYKVTLELDQQPADLRWGMSAEVHIQINP